MNNSRQFAFLIGPLLFLAILASSNLLITGRSFSAPGLNIVHERFLHALVPSAERAFIFGSRHLRSGDTEAYDVDLAEYFFLETVKLDPQYLYAYHQLARIAFLRGNFDLALVRINIELRRHAESVPRSYYVRGLVEGFRGEYQAATKDYETFLYFFPDSWAGINDYAWVLLRAGRINDAVSAIKKGLEVSPDNPWLLNSYATALYEIGDDMSARSAVSNALKAALLLTEEDWLKAYPGNDPRVATEGLAALREAVVGNMHTIQNKLIKMGYNQE